MTKEIKMTEKLYYKDSHMAEFKATVLSCEKEKDCFVITLDRTAFFPEGGGQSADTGIIGIARVLDVREKNGEILHYTDRPLPVGAEFEAAIDREQRLRRMQNHSGEHIVSGLVNATFGFDNVGFHMGRECMTIDFSGELSWEELQDIEKRANEVVRSNIEIKTFFPESEELSAMHYRSKLDLTENVRIVEIEGIDKCACCAPHVSRTGEIGLIKLLSVQRHRGGVRVELVCGMDALDTVRVMQENVTGVSNILSVKRHETACAVDRLLADQQRYKERLAGLSLGLAKRIADSYGSAENICVFDNILDETARRELVNMLVEKCSGMAAVFSGDDENGYTYIIGSRSIDLRAAARDINTAINGRGGGKTPMITGRAGASRETIEKFFG